MTDYRVKNVRDREAMEGTKKANILCIEALVKQMDGTLEIKNSRYRAKLQNRLIDFWPHSNSYYVHSQSQYGHGIANLVEQISDWYEQQQSIDPKQKKGVTSNHGKEKSKKEDSKES